MSTACPPILQLAMFETVRSIAPKPSDVEGTSERKAEYVRDRLAHIERHMQVRATRRRTVANIKYCKKCDEVTIPEESDEEFCDECKQSNE